MCLTFQRNKQIQYTNPAGLAPSLQNKINNVAWSRQLEANKLDYDTP
jgi:hypothetical protein